MRDHTCIHKDVYIYFPHNFAIASKCWICHSLKIEADAQDVSYRIVWNWHVNKTKSSECTAARLLLLMLLNLAHVASDYFNKMPIEKACKGENKRREEERNYWWRKKEENKIMKEEEIAGWHMHMRYKKLSQTHLKHHLFASICLFGAVGWILFELNFSLIREMHNKVQCIASICKLLSSKKNSIQTSNLNCDIFRFS